MANSIGAVFTRVVEGMQRALENVGAAIKAGLGSIRTTINHLFVSGKKSETILTTHPNVSEYNASSPTEVAALLRPRAEIGNMNFAGLHSIFSPEGAAKEGLDVGGEELQAERDVSVVDQKATKSKDKMTTDQFKDVYASHFLNAFGGRAPWKAGPEAVRKEVNHAFGQLIRAYSPEKCTRSQYKAMTDKLDDLLEVIATARLPRSKGVGQKVYEAEQVNALKQVNAEIKKLIEELK